MTRTPQARRARWRQRTAVLLPEAGYRQWVLTFPWPLRFRLAVDRPLFTALLRTFLRTLFAWQRRRGRVQARAGRVAPARPDRRSGWCCSLPRVSLTLFDDHEPPRRDRLGRRDPHQIDPGRDGVAGVIASVPAEIVHAGREETVGHPANPAAGWVVDGRLSGAGAARRETEYRRA